MPTIRHLTPFDLDDMHAIVDKHSSGVGAWCNDPSAPPRSDFRSFAKAHIDQLFPQAMSHYFGYFDDDGKLVAWSGFHRWVDNTNITVSTFIEDPDANLPRGSGSVWSDALIDVVNWGVGYFWSEGVECFWSRVYAGREDRHPFSHPNCLLNSYRAESMCFMRGGQPTPIEYRRVSWVCVGDDSMIYRFKDPLPLAAYLEGENDPTGNAG
jgi:hypothetical protein